MLTQILTYLHNFFPSEVRRGDFSVEDGTLREDFIGQGQYFRIQGSVYNDGVYQKTAEGPALHDETFSGTVTAMAVPLEIVELAEDVARWQEKYGPAAASPYLSEKFGDYSYTKGSTFGTVTVATSWQTAFAARLRPWRKLN